MSDSDSKPLNVDEIEALLRAARERQSTIQSDELSNEILDPSDVQHLRNTLFEEADLFSSESWPGSVLPDELLHQAEQQLAEAMSTQGDSQDTAPAAVQSFQFAPLDPVPEAVQTGGLPREVIDDIELDVTLELGRAEVTIEELMRFREGSVVPLDKAAGDPIDILANGRLIARGEVVIVDDKFGVRICEVISQG